MMLEPLTIALEKGGDGAAPEVESARDNKQTSIAFILRAVTCVAILIHNAFARIEFV
jgi:hypothetical protein